jgi:hypothetical protein
LVLVGWPAVGLLFSDGGSGHAWRLASLIPVDFIILEAVLAAWHKYDLAADALDRALSDQPDELRKLTRQLQRVMAPLKQSFACAVIAASLCLIVFLPTRPLVFSTVFSVLVCASTGLVVGQALYINVATLLLARQIRDSDAFTIDDILPRQSAGISELSRAVQVHAKAGLILVAVVMVPVTLGYLKSRSIHELTVLLALASLGPVSVIAIGFTVQMWVYEPATRNQQTTLQELAKSITRDYRSILNRTTNDGDLARLDLQLKLLTVVEEGDAPLWGKGSVLQYFVIALPILVQVALAVTTKYVG